MTLRITEHRTAPVTAYTDAMSYAPGSVVSVHASGLEGQATVDLVRLGHDGLLVTIEDVDEVATQTVALRPQVLPLGSHASSNLGYLPDTCTVGVWFSISCLPNTSATILALTAAESSIQLCVTSAGEVVLQDGRDQSIVGTVRENEWHLAAVVLTDDVRTIMTSRVRLSPEPRSTESDALSIATVGPIRLELGAVSVGYGQQNSLDGLIESPFVLSRAVTREELETWNSSIANRSKLMADGALVHWWDTSHDTHLFSVPDGAGSHALKLIGGPTRSLPGRWWTGDVHDPRLAPEQFGSIHFHSDDLLDAAWPVVAQIELPEGADGGIYGVRIVLESSGSQDVVPIIVRSPRPRAITVLLPTLTYLAYANEHACPPGLPEYFPDLAATFARENGLHSWYDRHRDGTPVVICSLRRPLLGFRHDHQFRYTGSDHGISADLRLMGWLSRNGFEAAVVTDHDLDRDGCSILAGTKCLITGAHPEYWSGPMLDALESFLDSGGNLAYLGGNGLVWSTHVDHEMAVAEMRRGDVDERPYEGDVATANLQLNGHRGGLWQTLGRPAASFTGLTAGCMGFTPGAAYHFTEKASSPHVASLLEGIDPATPFGASGQVLGAAAAYETDIFNPFLGSPADCTVLATATMPPSYISFAPGFHSSPSHEDATSRLRSDMVIRTTPAGGTIWSVGSVSWTGSLNDDPVVARMTYNALNLMSGTT